MAQLTVLTSIVVKVLWESFIGDKVFRVDVSIKKDHKDEGGGHVVHN